MSIINGRSMCPNCRHELAAKDLVPILSWLLLRGKCRYCHAPISAQYPLVEAATALAFVLSYTFWPNQLVGGEVAIFALWLILVVGLMALVVYDLRWMLLPDKIVFSLLAVAVAQAIVRITFADRPMTTFLGVVFGALVGGGIFYILFQVSKGSWIGGGDVKLGFLLGIIVAGPAEAFLTLFLASLLGTAASLPLLFSHKLKKSSRIPFGPFLILAAFIVVLFGHDIITWYQRAFLPYTM